MPSDAQVLGWPPLKFILCAGDELGEKLVSLRVAITPLVCQYHTEVSW